MKIYTKGGDQGKTSLLGGARVRKDDTRIEAYGTVDELSATLGMVLAHEGTGQLQPEVCDALRRVQADLFSIGAVLANPGPAAPEQAERLLRAISELEISIDEHDVQLPVIKNFILPGGTAVAAGLHFARVVCRRAERRVVALDFDSALDLPVIIYLNRLSDWLFVLARYANAQAGIEDTCWTGPARG